MVYARALDNILCAMKGHRLFDRFGFNLPKSDSRWSSLKLIENYEEFVFDSESHDWVDSNFKTLSSYIPSIELISLLNERIDKELN